MAGRKVFSLFGVIKMEGLQEFNKKLGQAEKEFRNATKAVDQFAKRLERTGKDLTKTITAPILGVAGAVGFLGAKAAETGDKISDLQQITALSSDSIQGLQNVARDAGVNFDGLIATISKLTSRMPQIMTEGGAAADAFTALGYSSDEVLEKSKNMDAFFPEIVNKLQGIKNVTDRNVISQQIFGKSLTDLAPVLGMTADEFNKSMEAAKGMSGYMSHDAVDAAAAFNAEIERVKAMVSGFGLQLGNVFIPILRDTVVPLLDYFVFPAFQKMAEIIALVAKWFSGLPAPIREGVVIFGALAAAIGPILIILPKLILMVKALYLAMATNPIGMIMVAIGLLITGIVLLVKNWDTVSRVTKQVWEDMVYFVRVGVSHVIEWMGKIVLAYLDTINIVAKYIPGFNKAIESASNAVSEMSKKQIQSREEMKLAREETLLMRKATKETTDTIKEAEAATTTYNMAAFKNADAKKEQTKSEKDLTAAVDDGNKSLQDRLAFEDQWAAKFRQEAFSRVDMMEWEKNEALRIAEEKSASTADIEAYYKIKSAQLAQEKANNEIAEAKRAHDEEMGMRRDAQLEAQYTANYAVDVFGMATDMIANSAAEGSKARKRALRAQMIAEKAASIFNIGVATIEGIARANMMLPPFGQILVGIRSAVGFAQAALVAAKPIPFADGGLVKSGSGGVVGLVAEGKEDELILPMKSGVESLAEALVGKLSGLSAPAGSSRGGVGNIILNIGTLVADELGLKKLEMSLMEIRPQIMGRYGAVA